MRGGNEEVRLRRSRRKRREGLNMGKSKNYYMPLQKESYIMILEILQNRLNNCFLKLI